MGNSADGWEFLADEKAAKRAAQSAKEQVSEIKWQLQAAEKRATEFEHKYEEALRSKPTGRLAHDQRAASEVYIHIHAYIPAYIHTYIHKTTLAPVRPPMRLQDDMKKPITYI